MDLGDMNKRLLRQIPLYIHLKILLLLLLLVLSHFWKLKTSDDVTKDLHAVRSLAIVMHSGIDKPVLSFTSSDQRRFGLPQDLIPLMRPCSIVTYHDFARTYHGFFPSCITLLTYSCVHGTVPASTHCTAFSMVGWGPIGRHISFP